MRKNSQSNHKKAQAILLCILCLFVATVRGQKADVVQIFEQVATLIRNNRLAEAEKELTAVLRVSPDLPVALNFLGTIRAKQNRLVEAESLFMRAASNDKNFTGPRMNLANLYLLKRTPNKAISPLQELLAIEPENAEALVMLGDVYLAQNDLQKAEDNYLQALGGRLDNAGALFGLAQISRSKGETRETAIYLNRVATLSADSKSPEFLYKFSLEAMRVGMFDEAKAALQRAVELKPKDPSYLLGLGIAWLRKGDLFESEKHFRRLLAMQPNYVQGQLHLGYALLNQKKYAEARIWLEKCARPGVAIPEAFYYLGLVEQEQNNDARAIVLFEKAVQKLPDYSHARIALGSSYMRLKNYARARQELETAVKLDPEEPSAHYNLALLYARIKEPDKAQEQMKIIEQLKAKGAGNSGVVVLPPKSNP